MTEFLTLFVLIIIIGAFIVKFGELFVALAKVVSYFAIPLSIAGVIFLLSKLFQEVIYARFYELAWQWLAKDYKSAKYEIDMQIEISLAASAARGFIRSHSTLSG